MNTKDNIDYLKKAIEEEKKQNYPQALEYIDKHLESENCTNTVALKAFYLCKVGETKQAFELANSIEFPIAWRMTHIYICFKAGKYQEALGMLESYGFDRILYSGYYAHAYFGLGKIESGHHMLGEVAKNFHPYSQDTLALLLSIYNDQNLKAVFTSDDFDKYCEQFLKHDFLECMRYSTQFFDRDTFNFFTENKNSNDNICISGTPFYQYQPLNLNVLSNIQNGCIYFSEYSKFNDPADPPIKLDEYFKPFQKATKNIRISCFTTKNDNLLMWSHYAYKHQGICIEYDIEAFLNRKDTYPILFQKVRYKENLSFRDEGRLQVSDPQTEDQTPWDTKILGLFTVKHMDWHYEDESRLIRYFDDHDVEFTSSVSIKSIYMGKDISPIHRKLIEDTVKGSNIQLFIMKPNSLNLYQLDTEEITTIN